MATSTGTNNNMTTVRYVLIAALIAVVFAVTYSIAASRSKPVYTGTPVAGGLQQGTPGAASGSSGSGDACCQGSGSGKSVEGRTTVENGVQRISVDTSGGYSPNIIRAAAGIPLEVTFAEGYGCMAEVVSADLGFSEDLTTGPKTIKIPALDKGEYGFSCGMQMVFGTIVVE